MPSVELNQTYLFLQPSNHSQHQPMEKLKTHGRPKKNLSGPIKKERQNSRIWKQIQFYTTSHNLKNYVFFLQKFFSIFFLSSIRIFFPSSIRVFFVVFESPLTEPATRKIKNTTKRQRTNMYTVWVGEIQGSPYKTNLFLLDYKCKNAPLRYSTIEHQQNFSSTINCIEVD